MLIHTVNVNITSKEAQQKENIRMKQTKTNRMTQEEIRSHRAQHSSGASKPSSSKAEPSDRSKSTEKEETDEAMPHLLGSDSSSNESAEGSESELEISREKYQEMYPWIITATGPRTPADSNINWRSFSSKREAILWKEMLEPSISEQWSEPIFSVTANERYRRKIQNQKADQAATECSIEYR